MFTSWLTLLRNHASDGRRDLRQTRHLFHRDMTTQLEVLELAKLPRLTLITASNTTRTTW